MEVDHVTAAKEFVMSYIITFGLIGSIACFFSPCFVAASCACYPIRPISTQCLHSFSFYFTGCWYNFCCCVRLLPWQYFLLAFNYQRHLPPIIIYKSRFPFRGQLSKHSCFWLGDQTEIRVDEPGRSEMLMVISTGVDSRDFLRIPGVDDWAMIKVLFVQWFMTVFSRTKQAWRTY